MIDGVLCNHTDGHDVTALVVPPSPHYSAFRLVLERDEADAFASLGLLPDDPLEVLLLLFAFSSSEVLLLALPACLSISSIIC